MKTALTVVGVVLLAGTLFSGVVQAQKTSAAHDKNVDFTTYKTFRLLITVVIVLIFDISHSRVGLIQIGQQPLDDLQQTMKTK